MKARVMLCSLAVPCVANVAAGAQRWAVRAEPTVSIPATSVSGDIHFEMAVGATRLATGEIVVADGSGASLKVFDAGGKPTRSVGRRGSGPGEFQYVSWMSTCGSDSIVVWDFMQRRLTWVDPQGTIARQTGPVAGILPFTLSCSRGGGPIVVHGWTTFPTDSRGVFRAAAPLALLDRSGAVTRIIDTIPSGELALIGAGVVPRPLGRYTLLAASRRLLYLTTSDSAVLKTYSLRGDPVGNVRATVPLATPSREQFDRAVESAIAFGPKPLRDRLRPAIQALAPPPHLPPYSAILVDPLDLVWLILSFPGEGATRLRAVDPQGRSLVDLSIPADLTVFEIGADYILAKYESPEGEQFVRLYTLQRGKL